MLHSRRATGCYQKLGLIDSPGMTKRSRSTQDGKAEGNLSVGDRATLVDTQTYDVGVAATSSARFYRPELDILRFVAFFAVYVTHSLPHSPAEYLRFHLPKPVAAFLGNVAFSGSFGVTLFFLLSAYLITSLLLREKSITGDVNLRSFYTRRILRIWPLYFLALGVAVVWPWGGQLPLKYLPGFLLLAGNWTIVIWGSANSWVDILWSVSIEEQFYLSWPHAVKKMSKRALLPVAIGLVVLANVTRIILCMTSPSPGAAWYNTFAQLDSLGAGILCAVILNGCAPRFTLATRALLGCAGIGLLISCGSLVTMPRALVALGYPCATVGCLCLFLGVCGLSIRVRPLVYLGKISYGLYVFHTLALRLVALALGGRAGTPLRFLIFWCGGLLITIALASLSYRWLESPFLRLKERFALVKSRPV